MGDSKILRWEIVVEVRGGESFGRLDDLGSDMLAELADRWGRVWGLAKGSYAVTMEVASDTPASAVEKILEEISGIETLARVDFKVLEIRQADRACGIPGEDFAKPSHIRVGDVEQPSNQNSYARDHHL